ncbi:SLATT domain-containing protein [Streptomyces sp. NPDC052492]|uniref:SLATT domain-containing protein n=1 Tax=Streptomyces tendae TaxID=1932 RepID=A0ABX5ZJH2_STRTE|nr:SLATT domain-containing protein [Streptomyces tendae]QER84671.1 SLATT domain-containing protein [Streptomyces tendae]
MVQPEMQPEGRPHDGRGDGAAGPWPGDPGGRAFPLGDWGEPAARLDELYRWVERGALDTAAWYLADRAWKRRCAWALRAGSALGALTGAALPLLDLTGAADGVTPWGYLALLLAVACVAGDRFFGMTSGWMRDVATVQAVHRRLQAFQFDWASECVREVLGPAEGTAGEAAERCLTVLRRFTEDVTELVRVETADWMMEFRSGGAPLGVRTVLAGAGRPEGAVPAGRLPSPPNGARPNMPRQRPPEAR